jgi:hypothetical protein
MVLQARLPVAEIGDSPCVPKPGAIYQDFRAFLEALSQGLQLFGLQPGFTPGPAGLLEPGVACLLPWLVPAPGRLPGDAGLAGHLGLAGALFEEPGRAEAALFQLVEVPVDTSWIAHARKSITEAAGCHYIMRESIETHGDVQ